MLAFQLVDIPDICFFHEAAEWLALGRIPEFFPTDYGPEARSDLEALTSEEYDFSPPPYAEAEIQAVGVEANYEDYVSALYEITATSIDEYINGVKGEAVYHRTYGPPSLQDFQLLQAREAIEEGMAPHMERASLTILLALMEGRLTAYGFKIPDGWTKEQGHWMLPTDDEQNYRNITRSATAEKIPASAWRGSPEVFHLQDRRVAPSGFVSAWIETRELFSLHPEPSIRSVPIEGHLYGQTIILNEAGSFKVTSKLKVRGRPKKGGGIVETAIVNEFSRRAARGQLPDKREALWQDCIDWAADILGENISRASAQRYLKPIISAQK